MSEQWQYQLRVYFTDGLAEVALKDRNDLALGSLPDILHKHRATLVSQFDAFNDYVIEAEREGPENYPLYKWTKATLDDPAKRAKHIQVFAVRVAGDEVYPKPAADALEADLAPLVGGPVVSSLSRHDTNPANNMPVPAAFRT